MGFRFLLDWRKPRPVVVHIMVGFVFSFVLVGAAVAVPRMLEDETPGDGTGSQPVGPTSAAVVLEPVDDVAAQPVESPGGMVTPQPVESPGGVVTPQPVESPGGVVTPQPVESPGGVVTPQPVESPGGVVSPQPERSPEPPPPTGPCARVPGSAVAVAPDPVQLPSGVYQGSFTIHHCAGDSVRWTIAKPPSISTSGESGTLEGGASQGIAFSIDPDQIDAGPFHLRIRVSVPGQNVYVDIHGTKPANANIGGLQTTEGDSRE